MGKEAPIVLPTNVAKAHGASTEFSRDINKFEVIVLKTPEEVDRLAASMVIDQIREKPDAKIVFPTGSTPKGMYATLGKAFKSGIVNFGKITGLNLDEYWPLPKNHPGSYKTYMDQNFYTHVNVPVERRHMPDSSAKDKHAEAQRYEGLLRAVGQPDLAILGIGPGTTCHIGFNERGSSYNSRTRYVELDQQTLQKNKESFPNPLEIPTGAITQGVGNILDAKKIILLAKGFEKAWGINRSLTGPICVDAPASFLRLHPNVSIILDEGAASNLPWRKNNTVSIPSSL